MSEVKRVKLISFGSQRVNDKNLKEPSKSIRISVILPESTEDNCPEFNYKDELATAKKKDMVPKDPIIKQTNGLDPFNEDDDDDVKRIAAEMEAKYGMGVTKKRKWRKDDYADIGMGYDETDSFIDNTDGYDEIIPKNVTTVLGGFYINSGALEFKTDENASSESSSSDEDTTDKTFNRKRPLESSAESDDDAQTEKSDKETQPDKKPKLLPNPNGMQNAIKKRLFNHDKIKQMNRKFPDDTKTVRELLKEKRDDLNMSTEIEVSEKSVIETTVVAVKEAQKPPPALASVDDVIESVILGGVNQPREDNTDESSKESFSSKDVGSSCKSASNSPETVVHNDTLSSKPAEIVQLPEHLPENILEIINNIKKAAASNTGGKVKFFSGPVNTLLLNLERNCRCLGKQSRTKVYEHLAHFVKCNKQTLTKRAKKLIILEEENKIKILLDRLKRDISTNMPGLIERHDQECRAVVQLKFSIENGEQSKHIRMPKRHFPWTDETKKLLRDAVALKKKCFLIEGRQKDALDQHVEEFLKHEIQPMWPAGWISIHALMKCCGHVFDIKKNAPKKITPTSVSDITPTAIPLTSNSGLTITPVPASTIVHKSSTNDLKTKSKLNVLNETIISKVNSDNLISISKPLPPADIVKASGNIRCNSGAVSASTIVTSGVAVKNDPDEITIEESLPLKVDDPVKTEEPENLSTQLKEEVKVEEPEDLSPHVNVTRHETLEVSNKETDSRNHCQIIDLTDQPELKKRPGPKSKTKYLYEYPDKSVKLKRDTMEHIRVKSAEELTGSSALTQIIADSLSDLGRFAQSTVKPTSSSNTVINTTASIKNSNESFKKVGVNASSNYDYAKVKPSNEGDDNIQMVMEGLKVLQKMSSPVKPNDELKTSSPVSVIAFNKSYSHDADKVHHNSSSSSNSATHKNSSFQDAFQKQFIPDFNLMKTSHSTHAGSSSKGSYNNLSKQSHSSTKNNLGIQDRYMQSTNNYMPQGSSKVKNNCASQQSGSYNMLDDMFANFLSEYGHTKPATSKSNLQHK